MCKVSVLMPVYNSEKYLNKAIDSILGQTFENFEFIIIDDCSTDNSLKIIESYTDKRIKLLKNDVNCGICKTLNKGLLHCTGEYIARMDSDDISSCQRFEKQVKYLDENPHVGVVGSSITIIDENDREQRVSHFSDSVENMRVDMFFACGVAHPSTMIRKDAFDNAGGYDHDFSGVEDHEMWCRILDKYQIVSLRETLLKYRVHEKQITQNPSPQLLEKVKVMKRRQVKRISAELTEDEFLAYFDSCCGRGRVEYKYVSDLNNAFEKVIKANSVCKYYNEDILKCTMANIIMGWCSALDKNDRETVISNTSLFNKRTFKKIMLGRSIKNALRRIVKK